MFQRLEKKDGVQYYSYISDVDSETYAGILAANSYEFR